MPQKNTVLIIPDLRVQTIWPSGKPIADSGDERKDVLIQNVIWAQQVKNSVPDARELVKVPVNGTVDKDFIPAIKSAAAAAGEKGMVILFTGHGSRPPSEFGRKPLQIRDRSGN